MFLWLLLASPLILFALLPVLMVMSVIVKDGSDRHDNWSHTQTHK